MIIGRDLEKVFIGNNYLSLISAITQKKFKKNVLIVDDWRVQSDVIWSQFITELDKSFLQIWGVVHNVQTLMNINEYLVPVCSHFFLDDEHLFLGQGPHQNLCELLRKCPMFFSELDQLEIKSLVENKEKFNYQLLNVIERMSEISFRFKNLQTLDQSLFQNIDFPLLKNLIQVFTKSATKILKKTYIDSLEQRCLLKLMKGLYQREIADQCSEFELSHLFLCLLSPHYKFKTKEFERSLKNELLELGGSVKKTTINQWQTFQNKLTHIELNSYEGVLRPSLCYYMGHLHPQFPFALKEKSIGLRAHELKIRGPEIFKDHIGDRLSFSSSNHWGTELPFIEMYIINERTAIVWAPFKNSEGAKGSLFKSKIIDDLDHYFQKAFIDYRKGDFRSLFTVEGDDQPVFWSKRDFKEFEIQRNVVFSNLPLFEVRGPQDVNRVDKFYYWGPERSFAVGLFSYLMDLKDHMAQWNRKI